MKIIVTLFGKMLIALLQLAGKSGSALPGLLVEKLYPRFLEKQLNQIEHGVVVVTGTNGKTTTTKALVYLLEQSGYKVLTNPTGSNFTRGIYATLLKYSSWLGTLDYDVAVLELDEAFSRKFAARYNPNYVLALNVMRDQLDRYGEIDATAEMIGDTISYAQKGVVLNADDTRIAKLAQQTNVPVEYFSIDPRYRDDMPTDDELHIKHPKKVKHSQKKKGSGIATLAHYEHGRASYRIRDGIYHTKLQVGGLHNAVNITAALAMTLMVAPHMKPQFIVPTIEHLPSAFGRGEIIRVGEIAITLALVKNPSGLRQSLSSYAHESFDQMIFAINDNFADGRDVSWLWDVDFTHLKKEQYIITSGIRRYDMALRLLYDERPAKEVTEDTGQLIAHIIDTPEKKKEVIIYCTYTAMLSIRKNLAKFTQVEDIWQ